MSSPLTITLRVGYRYRVTLSVDPDLVGTGAVAIKAEWSPKLPRHLSPTEIASYRRGRDALMAELANVLNQRILIAETGTGAMTVVEPASELGGLAS
jgi:hypothetical protein